MIYIHEQTNRKFQDLFTEKFWESKSFHHPVIETFSEEFDDILPIIQLTHDSLGES